ncbi:LytR/AlgR family response regulator transcription factor [Massilia niastensis]|uniref:LytR/AlgR family response regulator transcription factor n=1 Tax=Massilia niastensis TaxID=544911 RepID=UPI000360EC4E|nr:LytTR family DNA-binding domain-containing protein [Massilia niastensis]
MATALVADDEQAMRAQLRMRLGEAWPELRIVAEAANGLEAVDLAAAHRPDIAFLDIRMPGMGGIEAARQLYNRCHIVFVTAYDEYAVDAFEHGAIDYLLKPVTAERLGTACERLRRRLAHPPKDIGAQLAQINELLRQDGAKARSYLRWIQAQVGNSLRMISTREVLFFQSDEKYTCVQTVTGQHLIRKTLKELADELDPDEFWRIHRSTLVRVDAIAEVTRDLRGRHMLRLRNYPHELEVSRNHTYLFQQM